MRIIDYITAFLGLIFFSPLMIIIALLIRAGSKGPAVFRQIRVGKGQKPFICLKFRTMKQDTPHLPSHEVGASSITPLGAILRRTKLDELPQLINVLAGNMALVGPRPCLPTQEELIKARAREGAFAVLPGITGAAQVQGVGMQETERLAIIDGTYAKTRTLAGDLRIILQTAQSIAKNKSADQVK